MTAAPTPLFVYGTLMPGCEAWPVLAPWSTGIVGADAVAGRLYDTGRGYPAAVFAPGEATVHGVVVALDGARIDAALAALDAYEASEYERITAPSRAGLRVVTYHWRASLAGCTPIPGGRWEPAVEAETP